MSSVAMTHPDLPGQVIYVDQARTGARERSGWEIRDDLPTTPPPRVKATESAPAEAPPTDVPTAEPGDTTKEQ